MFAVEKSAAGLRKKLEQHSEPTQAIIKPDPSKTPSYTEMKDNLKLNRQLWQISMNNLPTETTNNTRFYLSLNTYLAAWLYTIESLTRCSSAMKQMTDQLNVMLCDIGSFVLDDANFKNRRVIASSESFKNVLSELGTTYRTLT